MVSDKPKTMVELVAQSIYDQQSDGTGPVSDFYPVACAAIFAMREPTQVMLAAGDGQLERLEDAEAVFTAMIDAALKESE